MHLRKFKYFEPSTLPEALALLAQYKEEAKILAGGTDLLVQMKQREISPKTLICLKSISELSGIELNGELRIGSMTTHRQIEKSSVIRDSFSLLADAVDSLGSVQIRNVATIGGNICNAAPSADTAPPLLALGAKAQIVGLDGERIIPLEEFFLGASQTVIKPNEILTRFLIAQLPPNSGSAYIKHTRRGAMDLPLLGVAVVVTLDAQGKAIKECRIALGVAAPTPIRASGAEEFLQGRPFRVDILRKAGEIASFEARPRTSMRTTAEYRREMIKVLIPRAASIAAERISLACAEEFSAYDKE